MPVLSAVLLLALGVSARPPALRVVSKIIRLAKARRPEPYRQGNVCNVVMILQL